VTATKKKIREVIAVRWGHYLRTFKPYVRPNSKK
jgi:hypothetical protein